MRKFESKNLTRENKNYLQQPTRRRSQHQNAFDDAKIERKIVEKSLILETNKVYCMGFFHAILFTCGVVLLVIELALQCQQIPTMLSSITPQTHPSFKIYYLNTMNTKELKKKNQNLYFFRTSRVKCSWQCSVLINPNKRMKIFLSNI